VIKKLIVFICMCSSLYAYDFNRNTHEIKIIKLGSHLVGQPTNIEHRAKAIERERGWKLLDLKVGQSVWYGVFLKKK